MNLLDIVMPNRGTHHITDAVHRITQAVADTLHSPSGVSEVTDTIDSIATLPDSANVTVVGMGADGSSSAILNLADVAPLPTDVVTQDGGSLTGTVIAIIVVVLALSLCFHFVFKYRKSIRKK